jgi:16S rRNA (cytidine1402-2'-O)-methyltransferase
MSGKLYICATPIGNLSDITFRVLDTLKEVDIIAAEDTRHTLKLLNHFDIKKPLISYYEHNKMYKGAKIIELLKEGKNIALVSDAGTPVISDPGEQLVKECIENQIEIESLPGACAAVTAITLCGLDTKRFIFHGFLPHKKQDKLKELNSLKDFTYTLVFYEAPHKLKATLECMLEVFGDRDIAILRELTKKYEQVLRLPLSESIKHFEENEPMGEFVLVVSGAEEKEEELFTHLSVKDHVDMYIKDGMDKKEAIKKCALDRNVPKRDIYNEYIK